MLRAGCALVGLMLAVALLQPSKLTAAQQTSQSVRASMPAVAEVGDEVITREELERAVAGQLARIEQQRHELLTRKLETLISERLLAQNAQRRGLSVEQLLKAEVYVDIPEVTDAEVATFIEQNRARLPKGDDAEVRLKVSDYLRSQKVNQRLNAYVGRLRDQTRVTVYLEEPTGTRVKVNPDKGVARGPKDAPVTIVEFMDFQCPFCKNVHEVINQVMGQYRDKVRLVFRDFPLASLHPTAPKAHEAARCAAEQGRFWHYYRLLYVRMPRHGVGELKQYAQELQLDATLFNSCLDSGKYQAEVASDIEEGKRLGVSSTPTFFINGIMLVGVQPLTAFQRVIDSELKKLTAMERSGEK